GRAAGAVRMEKRRTVDSPCTGAVSWAYAKTHGGAVEQSFRGNEEGWRDRPFPTENRSRGFVHERRLVAATLAAHGADGVPVLLRARRAAGGGAASQRELASHRPAGGLAGNAGDVRPGSRQGPGPVRVALRPGGPGP